MSAHNFATHERVSNCRRRAGLAATSLGLALVAINTASAAIPAGERQALIDLYNAASGGAWTSNTNWCAGACPASGVPAFNTAGTECTWYGVTCSSAQDHVVEIELSTNNLGGSLPALSALASLRYFAAVGNHIAGTIPTLASLAQLRTFYLDGNQFTGAVPALSALSNLEEFSAETNQLSGALPSLAGMARLHRLSLARNELSGTIPSLTGLTNLRVLDLSHNRLTGTIPDLSGAPNLLQVVVADNQLTGSIPALSTLTQLHSVDFGLNRLSGPVPAVPSSTFTPLTLQPSVLCPNLLSTSATPNDAGWNAATGFSPWWATPHASNSCDSIFVGTFEP